MIIVFDKKKDFIPVSCACPVSLITCRECGRVFRSVSIVTAFECESEINMLRSTCLRRGSAHAKRVSSKHKGVILKSKLANYSRKCARARKNTRTTNTHTPTHTHKHTPSICICKICTYKHVYTSTCTRIHALACTHTQTHTRTNTNAPGTRTQSIPAVESLRKDIKTLQSAHPTHTHTKTHIPTYTQTQTHTKHMHMQTCTYKHVHTHTHTRARMHTHNPYQQ